MECVDIECEKRNYCEKVHKMNNCKLNEDETIFIPNKFYYELNDGNRFVKRGLPSNGFTFGCYKLIEDKNGLYSLLINNEYVADFKFSELVDYCNNARTEMIESGEVKI